MTGYDKITESIPKPREMTVEALAEHLKEIGKAIISDAEHLAVDTHNLFRVHIEADVAPNDEVMSLSYRLDRYADPRIRNNAKPK